MDDGMPIVGAGQAAAAAFRPTAQASGMIGRPKLGRRDGFVAIGNKGDGVKESGRHRVSEEIARGKG